MKLFEKQVFIALSSKEQNVKAGSHCNFINFQLNWYDVFQKKQKLKKLPLKITMEKKPLNF